MFTVQTLELFYGLNVKLTLQFNIVYFILVYCKKISKIS